MKLAMDPSMRKTVGLGSFNSLYCATNFKSYGLNPVLVPTRVTSGFSTTLSVDPVNLATMNNLIWSYESRLYLSVLFSSDSVVLCWEDTDGGCQFLLFWRVEYEWVSFFNQVHWDSVFILMCRSRCAYFIPALPLPPRRKNGSTHTMVLI